MKYKSIAYVMRILDMFLNFFSCTCLRVIFVLVLGAPKVSFFQKYDFFVCIYNNTSEPIKLTELVVKNGYDFSIFH